MIARDTLLSETFGILWSTIIRRFYEMIYLLGNLQETYVTLGNGQIFDIHFKLVYGTC